MGLFVLLLVGGITFRNRNEGGTIDARRKREPGKDSLQTGNDFRPIR
jgi:hypothetical protein